MPSTKFADRPALSRRRESHERRGPFAGFSRGCLASRGSNSHCRPASSYRREDDCGRQRGLLGRCQVETKGTELTVTLPVTFAAALKGTKKVWVVASGPRNHSGWQERGTWTLN